MKLFIPTIGVSLKLTKPATVKVYFEDRNMTFLHRLGVYSPDKSKFMYSREDYFVASKQLPTLSAYDVAKQKKYGVVISGKEFCTITLPECSELSVDRIYLRKGVGDYDSVTFNLIKSGKDSVYGRFWLKLEDVNTLDVEVSRSVEDVKQAKVDRKRKQLEKEIREKQREIDEVVILKNEVNRLSGDRSSYDGTTLLNRTSWEIYSIKKQLEDQLLTWLSRNQIKELLIR